MVEATIEDLAITTRSSREKIWESPYFRRCCIEHELAKRFKIQTSTGTEAIVVKIRT